jgi:hypothetical protein
MAKSLLGPVDTGGVLLPWLDYRIKQTEQCMTTLFDEAYAEVECAAAAFAMSDDGIGSNCSRKANNKLSTLLAMSKVHRELKWVQQHPKFNNNERS